MAVNPMMAGLRQAQIAQGVSPLKKMFSMIKCAGNPQAAFGQLMAQNPQVKQAIDYVNANGGDAKAAFYKLAGEAGVDPDSILQQFNS